MSRRLLVILALIVFPAAAWAQIPNGSFETWDSTAGYKVPVGWDNVNASTASTSVFTCQAGNPGYSGNYFLNLTSRMVTGMGVVPGIAVSGKLDPVTHLPVSGFPYASRPQILTGQWQYMAFSAFDQGYIAVVMTKWNVGTGSRDTISNTFRPLPSMIMYWVKFAIPINYVSSATPDSAMIILSASGATMGAPADNSFLYVDDLLLTDSVALEAKAPLTEEHNLAVFPNPAKGQAFVSYHSLVDKAVNIAVNDINGRMVSDQVYEVGRGDNQLPVNIASMPKGMYFIKVTADETIEYRKLVIE
jgi:Secretion system C-terminal sorting domain